MIDHHPGLTLAELKEIIAEERVVAQFQSILSARNHSIIGFEGLIRGKTRDGDLISPVLLFDAARDYNLSLEFDRLCREKVLAAFKNIYHDTKKQSAVSQSRNIPFYPLRSSDQDTSLIR